ncbi:hypothetical protein RF11_02486 [Thelohanellus kitauei]|uniref:Uncharacterized protein n=1 Tax=Thelohanellus kitauei TaxID=669202 RepID=A0A0C2J444_THEKT|nr:hypothetical protein RF11_02486 [Thelohanellus kitauei]
MQPFQKISDDKINLEDYIFLISLYDSILLVCSQIVKLLTNYTEISIKTLYVFLERFRMDVQRIFGVENTEELTKKIVHFCNVETDKFSLMNLSHRVFVDILMDCCVKGTLTPKIRDHVFGDVSLLIWISGPTITAISSTAGYLCVKKRENLNYFNLMNSLYLEAKLSYLYIQDFNMFQILISHLDPELFLKYLLLNVYPFLRNLVDFSKPVSSMILLLHLRFGLKIGHLLNLIYNAFTERHFVGVYDNPQLRFLDRQIIHCLAMDDRPMGSIKNHIFISRDICSKDSPNMRKELHAIVEKVSFKIASTHLDDKISLKPEYFKELNMFYFMYKDRKCNNVHKKYKEIFNSMFTSINLLTLLI